MESTYSIGNVLHFLNTTLYFNNIYNIFKYTHIYITVFNFDVYY